MSLSAFRRAAPSTGVKRFFVKAEGCGICAEYAPKIKSWASAHGFELVEVDALHPSLPPMMVPAVAWKGAGGWELRQGTQELDLLLAT